jgi:hypothetical protein
MANYQRTIWRILASIALGFVAGYATSEPQLAATTYSAIGAQVK